MQRWPCGDEGFAARWHHAVDFPGADYVQMAVYVGGSFVGAVMIPAAPNNEREQASNRFSLSPLRKGEL